MPDTESHCKRLGLIGLHENQFVEVCGAGIRRDYLASLSLHKFFFSLSTSSNFVLWRRFRKGI